MSICVHLWLERSVPDSWGLDIPNTPGVSTQILWHYLISIPAIAPLLILRRATSEWPPDSASLFSAPLFVPTGDPDLIASRLSPMSSQSPLSDQQIDAVFTEVLKDEAPAEVKAVPMADRLAPYRKKLIQYHHLGYSSQQLVKVMAHPKIGIQVSASFLRKFVSGSGKRAKRALKKGQTVTGLPPMRPAPAAASATPAR